MKKLISILACITLIACLVIPVSAENDFAVSITPAATTLSANDSATFDLNISGLPENTTSAAIEMTLTSGLQYSKIKWGEVTEADPSMKNFNKNTLQGVFMADTMGENDTIHDGTLATFTILVTNAPSATETVKIGVAITVAGNKQPYVYNTATITIAHDHVYTAETVDAKYLKSEATCTSPAVYYKSCTVCGEASTTETFTSGEALNHDFKDTIVPPTCTEKGYTEHVCSRGDSTTKDTYTDALGHDLIEEVDGKYLAEGAGCTEPATYYKHCSRCDFISNETFKSGKAAGHTPGTAVVENKKDSTCTAEGSYDEVIYCTVCKAELSRETKTILKKEHTPGAAKQENLIPATCTADGSYDEVVYCTVCKTELSREPKTILKIAHTPGAAKQENVVDATCTEAGSYDEVVYCTVCKNELSREKKTIKALGHEFSTEWTTNPEEHYHKCIRCKERADFGYHEAGEWVVIKEPTTKEKGERAKLCTVCGYELVSEPIDELVEYKVTEGADTTFKAGGKAIKFGTNIPKAGLAGLVVKVDGVEVDPENYTISGEEEVEVELKPEYLATLKAGKHTVTIADGVGIATAEITVEKAASGSSPKTANLSFYFALLLLLSAAVLVSNVVYRKKVK